jgi:ACS family tartrate transporter-like MFS transporter
VPSLVLGVVVLWRLPNGPRQARWLTFEELGWLEGRLELERVEQERGAPRTWQKTLFDRRVLLFSAIYFLNVVGGYGLDFYTPTLLAQSFAGFSRAEIGWVAAIPPLVALPLMVLYGQSADRRRSHAKHVALAAACFAVGLGLLSLQPAPVLVVLALTLCVAGRWCLIGPFWSLPTAMLSGTAAAGGIAWINSLGNLGGQAGPVIVSRFALPGGGLGPGLGVLAVLLVICALLALWLVPRSRQRG